MVTAVIFAGGVGARMKSSVIPKQFIKVDGKEIIIRTLENFSNHPLIDSIVIACLEEWMEELNRLLVKYKVDKVTAVVKGGDTGHQSIHNGLSEAAKRCSPDDVVLICDGVRPLVSEKLITDCIKTAGTYETAVPVTPSIDSVLESTDGENCNKSLPRGSMWITQAPQGYTLKRIMWAHDEAEKRGILNPISSSELLISLGETVKIFNGDRENIKVTTPEDLRFLRAFYYFERFIEFTSEELKNDE